MTSKKKTKAGKTTASKKRTKREGHKEPVEVPSSADMLDRVKLAIEEVQSEIADTTKNAANDIPTEVAIEDEFGSMADTTDAQEPIAEQVEDIQESEEQISAERSDVAVKVTEDFTSVPGVLIAAAEAAPLAKTGGLADVVGALPKYLKKLGVDARIIMPFHRQIKEKYRMDTVHLFDYLAGPGWSDRFVGIDKLELDGVTYYFVDNEYYFGSGKVYSGDNFEGEQYGFFAQAVVDSIPNLDFEVGLVHCNDWHTAVIPFKLKARAARDGSIPPKTLLTIHNLAYQGTYGKDLDARLITAEDRAYAWDLGSWNLLKAGIDTADRVNTVSPTYAWEITTSDFGEGLEHDLWWKSQQGKLTGILNGIDIDAFDPKTDKCLPKNFDRSDLKGKRACKEALLEELGLDADPDAPLIATIGRLTPQKGVSMAADIMDSLVSDGVMFVNLGSGYPDLEKRLRDLEWAHHGRICSYIGYNDDLAHRIYAASDFFLMPSAFEPCGISQMIAMRYGSLPIVHETGGLKDTVEPYNQYSDEGCGFTFARFDFWDAIEACKRALAIWDNKTIMNRLIENAMSCDFSFDRCARSYAELYREMTR